MYLHLYNVIFSDISSKAHNVPGGGLQDDVLVLAEGRDLEADLQRHLHVPEKHNLGLSTWCIKRLGSQLTVIHKKKKKNGQKWGNLRFYEAGSVQSLVLVHAAEASRVKFPPSFFFFNGWKEKGKNRDLSNASSVLSFLSLDSCRSGKIEESKKRSETVFFRIFPRWNYFARSLDDDVALIFSSQLGPSIPTKVLLYIVYSILNTEYAYTAILSTDKSIHLYIRD